MKDCVHYVPLIGAHEGELTPEEQAGLDRHLAGCAACRAREADARALGPLVRDALMAEANKRDFAPFVDQVMARIEAHPLSPRVAGPSAAQPRDSMSVSRSDRRGEGGTWWQWLTGRRAAAAALVPALAAAALLVYVQTRPGVPEVASLMELTSEGEVTMILQTSDGPLVLLGEERS
jgi:anti-sigma factor RsiW